MFAPPVPEMVLGTQTAIDPWLCAGRVPGAGFQASASPGFRPLASVSGCLASAPALAGKWKQLARDKYNNAFQKALHAAIHKWSKNNIPLKLKLVDKVRGLAQVRVEVACVAVCVARRVLLGAGAAGGAVEWGERTQHARRTTNDTTPAAAAQLMTQRPPPPASSLERKR